MGTLIISGASISQAAKKTGGISRTVADLTSEPGHAREYADEFQETFNANEEPLRRYANNHLTTGDAVAAIRFADRRGNHAKRFLVASANESSGDLREARVIGPKRFEGIDRSVNQHIAADWYLSRNAAAELEAFVVKFADRNRDPSQAYLAKTAAKYGDSVEGNLVDRMVDQFEGS